MPIGGKIDRETALKKHQAYKDYTGDLGGDRIEFVVFTRLQLQEWITNLPDSCDKLHVYLAMEGNELDVLFWPSDSLSTGKVKTDEEGYNIGNRQPYI